MKRIQRRRFHRWSVVVGLLLSLVSCAGGPGGDGGGSGPPDWLTGQARDYPPERYLTGIGEGRQASTARDRARADLAKSFEVAIAETSSDLSEFRDEGSGRSSRQRISRDIRTRTFQVLEGVEIAELWFDPVGRRYHALAVLQRDRARRSLIAQIDPLDRQTADYLERADAADRLGRIAYLARAIELQRRRERLQRLLRVVDTSGRGRPARWSIEALTALLDTAFDGLRVERRVEACDEGDRAAVARALDSGLARAGVEVDPGADLVLVARLSLDPPVERQGWTWLRGRLELALASGGRTIGIHRWGLKQSAVEERVARRRLEDEIARVLGGSGLRPVLIDLLGRLVDDGEAAASPGETTAAGSACQ